MVSAKSVVSSVVGVVNSAAVALLDAPVVGPFVGRRLMRIRYVGRRSGRTIETPVAYHRSGDTVTIGVGAAGAKAWWRNFGDDGGPITLVRFDGRDRTGHASAHRDARGRVSVTVRLDPPA